MQQPHDLTVIYLIVAIYAFTFYLILRQVEMRLRIVGKIICRFRGHKYEPKAMRCSRCDKFRDRSHLKLVQGGKKDLGSTFRW